MYTSSSTNRLRWRTPASRGSSEASDSANSLATASSAPGLILATMQPLLIMRPPYDLSRLVARPIGIGPYERRITTTAAATSAATTSAATSTARGIPPPASAGSPPGCAPGGGAAGGG